MDFEVYWMGYGMLFFLTVILWGIITYIRTGRQMINSSIERREFIRKVRMEAERIKAEDSK